MTILSFIYINVIFKGKVSQLPSLLRRVHLKWRRTIKRLKLLWMDLENHGQNLVSIFILKCYISHYYYKKKKPKTCTIQLSR